MRAPSLFIACLAAVFSGPLAAPALAEDAAIGLVAAADPLTGEKVFLRCKACHTAGKGEPNRLGPNLWGIVGRGKASAAGFRYSPALEALGGIWDYEAISAFLKNPRALAPRTRMVFAGIKDPAQRASVIAYLRTQADNPPPPPAASANAVPASTTEASAAAETFGGLPPGEGREETHAICGACHSLHLVTQQSLPGHRWDTLMDWMTEKQGMPELANDERARIVRYLAEHFGPDRDGYAPARSPMAPAMPTMPANPMAPRMPPMPGN